MKVLIVRLSSFGDVVHTYPALTDLARARPEVEIDWLVDEGLAALAGLHPAVGNVVGYAERRLRWPPTRWPARFRARSGLRRRLRQGGYDLVVDLQGLLKSALVARLAGAPVVGYDAQSIREPMASRFYARRYAVAKDLHAVERNRRLLAAALGYEVADATGAFGLKPDAGAVADGLPERFCLFVHSASWPSKLWSEENWRRLAERLSAQGIDIVLPWGNEGEKARAERIAAGIASCHVLPGRLDGFALAGAVRRAQFAVGLDSGLMHLATALAVPGVWLFGPTDPGLTGPYGPGQMIIVSTSPDAPCRTRDCGHAKASRRCMDLVDFERVAAAVDALVATAGR
jgi:heptosyltransferase-1